MRGVVGANGMSLRARAQRTRSSSAAHLALLSFVSSFCLAMAAKRGLADSEPGPSQPIKRTKNTTLNSFFEVPASLVPDPLVASESIDDRDSLFIAHAAPVTSLHEYHRLHNYVRQVLNADAPASHVMIGAR
jgi:hypothetical protein